MNAGGENQDEEQKSEPGQSPYNVRNSMVLRSGF
jgi:hypothetical protein